jgi:hypothetical protein
MFAHGKLTFVRDELAFQSAGLICLRRGWLFFHAKLAVLFFIFTENEIVWRPIDGRRQNGFISGVSF